MALPRKGRLVDITSLRGEVRRAPAVIVGHEAEVAQLLDRFCSRALRSGLKPFVTLAKTIRTHRPGIFAAIPSGSTTPTTKG